MATFTAREQALSNVLNRVTTARQAMDQARSAVAQAKAQSDPANYGSDITAALTEIAADDGKDLAAQYQAARAARMAEEAKALTAQATLANSVLGVSKTVLDAADLKDGVTEKAKQDLVSAITAALS